MPQPTRGDVHVSRPLTNISIAYVQDASNFVAARVFPNIPVQKQADSYFTYDRSYWFRDEAEKRAPGAESAGSGYGIGTSSYSCDVFAIHKDVADQIRANADSPIALDREATLFVTQKLMLKREKQFVADFFAGGKWTYDYDGVASSAATSQTIQWSNDTTGDPIGDVDDAKADILESTGFEPNTMVIGYRVWTALRNHPDIIDRVKYVQNIGPNETVKINERALADLFGVQNFYVMRAVENTAAEGDTAAYAFIAGKHALLCYSAPTPGVMLPSAGYTFSWNGYLGAGAEGNRIKNFRMEANASDRVEGEMAFDMKLVAADLGFFWENIVA